MKKTELLQLIDQEFLDRLYGFCYGRTSDSWEAQELCSDILLALVKSAGTAGEVTDMNAYIWRIARNVYADFSRKRAEDGQRMYAGDPDELFALYAQEMDTEDNTDQLNRIYRGIGLLSKAYRDVLIAFYLDGLSIREIARRIGISENTARQRLFAARKNVQNEVLNMESTKPVCMERLDFTLWGSGNPGWSDPRKVCTRQMSKHVVWLCREKPQTARNISDALHIPMPYAEEELKILTEGENGKYGMLRKEKGGKYATNFVLLDKAQMQVLWDLTLGCNRQIVDSVVKFIDEHEKEFLAFPFLNQKVDFNLILWQKFSGIANRFGTAVERILQQKHFAHIKRLEQPFIISGYQNVEGTDYGFSQNGVEARNICGYSYAYMSNIDCKWIKRHFRCDLNLGRAQAEQLAIRAIHGLDIDCLDEREREYAAKAIEEGYLYREGDQLYTKVLAIREKDSGAYDALSDAVEAVYEADAKMVAERLAAFINKHIPARLLEQWYWVCRLAHIPLQSVVMDALVENGYLIPPNDGIGAEGCLIMVEE